MDEEELPAWLQFLAFGDGAELRFPLILLGVAVLAFATFVEVVDGLTRHLEHVVPFSALILAGLALRAWLGRRYPQPLGPS